MYTEILKIDPDNPEKDLIRKAGNYIKENRLCVFPTETVYGLGANALNSEAVSKIFLSKGRPSDNPLILHVDSLNMMYEYVENISEKANILINKFMPGPLAIILKKNINVPDVVTAGLDTVAVRMPGNTIALELIKEAGVPIAAPSANISGKPSPTLVEHVFDDLFGRVDCIIDGGPTNIGIESTVVDLTEELPILLRPGNISLSMLETEIGIVRLPVEINEIRSPGLKYKHYAPNAEVIISESYENMMQLAEMFRTAGKNVGLVSNKATNDYKHTYFYESKDDLARDLFAVFRQMDKIGIDVIIVNKVDEEGIGAAIMNRLEKSAAK